MRFQNGAFVTWASDAGPRYGVIQAFKDPVLESTAPDPADSSVAPSSLKNGSYRVVLHQKEGTGFAPTVDEVWVDESLLTEHPFRKAARVDFIPPTRREWMSGMEEKGLSGPQDVENRTVTGICSVFGNIDDGRDMVLPGAFVKTIQEGLGRVRFLWNHDFYQPPTARIDEVKEVGRGELPPSITSRFPEATGGLLVRRTYLNTPRGNEIFEGIQSGALNEMSFGFNPVKFDMQLVDGQAVRILREVRLLDVSDVPWGMNPATVAAKGAVPYAETPLDSKDADYDGDTEMSGADDEAKTAMCAYVKDGDPAAYFLPHHLAAKGHAVSWKGCQQAMKTLLNPESPFDWTPSERKAVYDHLAKHYAQFGEEPPDYKRVELAFTVKDAIRLCRGGMSLKVGRQISAANQGRLQSVVEGLEGAVTLLQDGLEALESLLDLAEPPEEEDAESDSSTALTNAAILQRIDIAKRMLWR